MTRRTQRHVLPILFCVAMCCLIMPLAYSQQAPETSGSGKGASADTAKSDASVKELEMANRRDELINTRIAMYAVCIFALASWVFLFVKMKPDFGPTNLRALGIVLVTSFATFLALFYPQALSAAIGLLGAVAGYLFGMRGGHAAEDAGPSLP